jgi:hypothetical protein
LKTCTTCNVEKEITDFYKQPRGKFGVKSECKHCQKAYNIYRVYKLSIEEYSEMASSGCNICHTDVDLVVDHCHYTGVVRGILCRQCNSGIGLLKDNSEILARAYAYLTGGKNVA